MMYEQQHHTIMGISMMGMEVMGKKGGSASNHHQKHWRRSSSSSSLSPPSSPSSCTADEQRLEIVDLSGLSLDCLPKISLNLANICKLDLSNNNLQRIPESLIARLLNVVALDIHSNQLNSLPNSVGCLTKLKFLNVSGNFIEYLPRTIEDCKSLEELNANFNKLKRLPDGVGFELVNLKRLSVNSNKLLFLPMSITHLTSLQVLDARLNCLQSLPEDIENLVNLEVLNVSQNFQYLTALPDSVGLLMSLVELDVSYNGITTLPSSMGCLRRLAKLHVEGNPLVSPPLEVVEQGVHVVKEYLNAKINEGENSVKRKKSWRGIVKLVKYGTFHQGRGRRFSREEKEDLSVVAEHKRVAKYDRIEAFATPRHVGPFSPRRLLSPFSRRSYFGR